MNIDWAHMVEVPVGLVFLMTILLAMSIVVHVRAIITMNGAIRGLKQERDGLREIYEMLQAEFGNPGERP